MGEISGIDCSDLGDDTHMHIALHRGLFSITYTHINRHTYIKSMTAKVSVMLRCEQSTGWGDIFYGSGISQV